MIAETKELKNWHETDEGIITQYDLLGPDEGVLANYNGEFNQAWKERWYNYFAEMFTESGLFKELQSTQGELWLTQEERDYFAGKLDGLLNTNEELLKANIELEETNKKLKNENVELRKKIGAAPSSFLDAAGKLVKSNVQKRLLINENMKLKEKAEHPLNKIEPDIVEQILLLKAKGLKGFEIAEKTGVSASSVSRYIGNNQKRLSEIMRSLEKGNYTSKA